MGEGTWPLSAPAASILISLPGSGSDPQPLSADAAPVKVALQELLACDALTLEVVRDGVLLTEATLGPGTEPDALSRPLNELYRSVRPLTPGALKDVLTKAHRRNPAMTTDVRRAARGELVDRGLIEEESVRRLGRRHASGWRRTGAGDDLAEAASACLERLRRLQDEVDRDSEGGIEALFAADSAAAPAWEEIELEGGNKHAPHSPGTWLGGS